MISRAPSFRMMASFPGSSNSRGMRTAWFVPFLNSFTCCSLTTARRFTGIGLSICQIGYVVQHEVAGFGEGLRKGLDTPGRSQPFEHLTTGRRDKAVSHSRNKLDRLSVVAYDD